MNRKQKTAGKTATKTNGGAQGAAKGNGKWRETRRNGERVLIDPAGRIIHGTAQEVREAALTPERRDELAQSIEWARHIADKFGYQNAANLTRSFTREMGMSPSKWLEKHIEKRFDS